MKNKKLRLLLSGKVYSTAEYLTPPSFKIKRSAHWIQLRMRKNAKERETCRRHCFSWLFFYIFSCLTPSKFLHWNSILRSVTFSFDSLRSFSLFCFPSLSVSFSFSPLSLFCFRQGNLRGHPPDHISGLGDPWGCILRSYLPTLSPSSHLPN